MSKDTITESTIARIAGNLLSGTWFENLSDKDAVASAVLIARAIAAEVRRTAPNGTEAK